MLHFVNLPQIGTCVAILQAQHFFRTISAAKHSYSPSAHLNVILSQQSYWYKLTKAELQHRPRARIMHFIHPEQFNSIRKQVMEEQFKRYMKIRTQYCYHSCVPQSQ